MEDTKISAAAGNKRKLKASSRFKLLAAITFIGYLAVTFSMQQATMNSQRAEIEAIRYEIEAIKVLNDTIQLSIDIAGTREYMEQTARDQLGYLKKGELRFTEDYGLQP